MQELSRRLLLGALVATPSLAYAQPQAINVRSVGEGARAWVLVHPFGASGRFWEARAAALAAQHGVRVLSPDMPSHGASRIVQHFDYASTASALASALSEYAEAVDVIIGASSGGLAALKLGAQWRKPVAAIGVGYAFSAANIASMSAEARTLTAGSEQWVIAFLEQGAPQRAAIQRHYGDLARLGEGPLVTAAECAALAGNALIINGAADDFFSRESAHALADAIPRSLLTFITGAGHLEPLGGVHRDFTWGEIATFVATRARA